MQNLNWESRESPEEIMQLKCCTRAWPIHGEVTLNWKTLKTRHAVSLGSSCSKYRHGFSFCRHTVTFPIAKGDLHSPFSILQYQNCLLHPIVFSNQAGLSDSLAALPPLPASRFHQYNFSAFFFYFHLCKICKIGTVFSFFCSYHFIFTVWQFSTYLPKFVSPLPYHSLFSTSHA